VSFSDQKFGRAGSGDPAGWRPAGLRVQCAKPNCRRRCPRRTRHGASAAQQDVCSSYRLLLNWVGRRHSLQIEHGRRHARRTPWRVVSRMQRMPDDGPACRRASVGGVGSGPRGRDTLGPAMPPGGRHSAVVVSHTVGLPVGVPVTIHEDRAFALKCIASRLNSDGHRVSSWVTSLLT